MWRWHERHFSPCCPYRLGPNPCQPVLQLFRYGSHPKNIIIHLASFGSSAVEADAQHLPVAQHSPTSLSRCHQPRHHPHKALQFTSKRASELAGLSRVELEFSHDSLPYSPGNSERIVSKTANRPHAKQQSEHHFHDDTKARP